MQEDPFLIEQAQAFRIGLTLLYQAAIYLIGILLAMVIGEMVETRDQLMLEEWNVPVIGLEIGPVNMLVEIDEQLRQCPEILVDLLIEVLVLNVRDSTRPAGQQSLVVIIMTELPTVLGHQVMDVSLVIWLCQGHPQTVGTVIPNDYQL